MQESSQNNFADLAAKAWHTSEAEEALAAFSVTQTGLTGAEAEARLAVAGPNRLPLAKPRPAWKRFVLQFHNLLIYVLLAAALLSVAIDHAIDAAVILGVVLVNAVIGFIQEGKAEEALNAIRAMIDPKATVLRDGRRLSLPADQIVPGDIVFIEAGDRVPADLRLIRARNLKLDEAILTGESVAVDKSVKSVAVDAPLGEREGLAFSGTFVAAGQGLGVAIATGRATQLGHISKLLGGVEVLKTPLIRQVDGFAKQLSLIIFAVSSLAFLFGYFVQNYPLEDAFMIVIGLAVAAIPEGLPAIMTITLAIGVERMAARNAIIRRLPAVETLGSVSIICSDKTGTLTRNEMLASAIVTGKGAYRASGSSYAPEGSLTKLEQGSPIDPKAEPLLTQIILAGLLCNDASLRESDRGWVVDGDPMEGALVTLAMKADCDPEQLRKAHKRRDEIPFDARHRYMATLHEAADGKAQVFIKGAPERLLELCSFEQHSEGKRALVREPWLQEIERLASKGQRVLAFARKTVAPGTSELSQEDLSEGLELLGFIGFIDPPRPEAIEAVAECQAAGIRVVMITGDHALTARAIARELGLGDAPEVLTGQELDELDDKALGAAAHRAAVFARTTPEHKLRLVEALQRDGLIVAMTGDGVNDAPALKRADVGVAMGGKGTEVAKEASEIVLADDNFASIVAAVREGRTVYDNLMKVITWTLPTNGGESLIILSALALGLALPITPLQILWINMITAVALGLTLAFEPSEPNVMQRPPRRAGQAILSGDLLWRVVFVSILFVIGAFGVYRWAEGQGVGQDSARTLTVNTIVVMEIFYLFSVRYVHGTSLSWQGVLGTPAVLIGVSVVVVGQLLFTYLPFMQKLFGTAPVTLYEGLVVMGVGLAMLVVVELEKRLKALVLGRLRT